ncbi:rhodanese-like domain-containing protein [Floccifex sp.]|uniref:rhodanese-like domain-containing protein n=1 Tax=Floccifex sp. TaxID=2815810 RepID=UPI002A747587|nr:rhodanese-like domain-containing protein [Floccifex sp.]MDD7280373.1 rhodanese-like domain-containing protein [Erysipelotrichaceae bacterium]MDY2957894.1 rhodanese-like domain-containing protein [Floccifex sp.]
MKKIILCLFLFLVVGCTTNTGYQNITPKQAIELLETEECILLDVRTLEEYESGYIPGAINVPLDSIETFKEDKDACILVYCRSGNRSKKASQLLVKMGYKNVYDLGGIQDWPYVIVQ